MFVLVKQDLGNPYKMVQGAHALAKYALEFPQLFKEWNNETIVFVDVKNLLRWEERLTYSDEVYCSFTEPDLNDELTAIACFTRSDIFNKLNLAK